MTLCDRESGGRILCIRLSGFGDIVHALNALSLLRKHRPDAHIVWITEERFRHLLSGHPLIDELMCVPRTNWEAALKSPLSWPTLIKEVLQLAKELRNKKFDISIDFQGGLKSAWLVAAAGAPTRIGFGGGVARELSHLVQYTRVLVREPRCHRVERDIALLCPLGIPSRYEEPVVVCSPESKKPIDRFLADRSPRSPLVVIHPGTSGFGSFKRWTPERYCVLADRLVAERGAGVIVTWGPDEEDLARGIVDRMRQHGELAPRTAGLQQLAHLLSQADLFIGSDSGPMHLASAVGVPVVALFGPKDEVQTGPYCSRSEVVSADVECRPCTKRRCADVRCMKAISVEDVFAAACRVLDGGGSCRAGAQVTDGAFTFPFELGRWKGEVVSAFSAPEFYKRLCAPDVLGGRAGSARARSKRAVSHISVEVKGERQQLIAKKYRPPRGLGRVLRRPFGFSKARRSWRISFRLRNAGLPVPFHVCYLQAGHLWRKEQVLVLEYLPAAVALEGWLGADEIESRTDVTPQQKLRSLDATAALIREFHRGGFFHGDLRIGNLMISWPPGTSEPSLYLTDIDMAGWVGWLPPAMREILRALDIRRFLRSLDVPVPGPVRARFLDGYFEGFVETPHRRRLLRWFFQRFAQGRAAQKGRSNQRVRP